jgi:hypothetical protein
MPKNVNDDWIEKVAETNDEVWDRKDVLEGVFKSVRAGVGPNESKLYVVKVKDEEVALWGSTVLDTKLADIAPGTPIRITPMGEVKSEKTGRKYMDFKVEYKTGYVESQSDEGEPMSLDDIPFGN